MLEIIPGDCIDTLRTFPGACIDAVVTDPPYGLSKEPDAAEVLRHWLAGEDYEHSGGGFMGKSWDSFVPGPAVWREVLRVLKPGGHLLSFFGTRTYDLGTMAIRLAGFQIRDQLAWMYGTGFPKSLDVSKAIDKAAGHWRGRAGSVSSENGSMGGPNYERTPKGDPITPDAQRWTGWGTALKPAQEPICLARKPLAGTVAANVLAHGTGGLNVDGCRIGTVGGCRDDGSKGKGDSLGCYGDGLNGPHASPKVDGLGRWPANVILDEAAAGMLDEQSGVTTSGSRTAGVRKGLGYHGAQGDGGPAIEGSTGGASRFFYCAKASKAEREAGLEHLRKASAGELTGGRKEGSAGLDNPRAGAGRASKSGRANTHPTVKPIALMRYLVRLITPPNGIVLDPYAGSGTTGIAAALEGFRFVGLELDEQYTELARARIAHVAATAQAA